MAEAVQSVMVKPKEKKKEDECPLCGDVYDGENARQIGQFEVCEYCYEFLRDWFHNNDKAETEI